jgi:hypothetical protein
MKKDSKEVEYATKVLGCLSQLFDEDSEFYIDLNQVQESDTANEFFHALATMTPNVIFNKFTGQSLNALEFNHVANRLCFEFAQLDKIQ